MQLRDALITQAPSLALQRAAASEIARLDNLVHTLLRAAQAAAPLLEGTGQPAHLEPLQGLRFAILRAVQ